MSDFIRSRVVTLAGIIVFGSLCDIILPNGTYRKYIQLTLGIMLCLAILSPNANTVLPDLSDVSEIFDYDEHHAYETLADADDFQMEQILAVYERKLSENIKSKAREYTDADLDIKCKVSDKEASFGNIENIWINVFGDGEPNIPSEAVNSIAHLYNISESSITVKYIHRSSLK